MPMYDTKCDQCGHRLIDVYEPIAADPQPCPQPNCAGTMRREITCRAVIGDECDVEVRNGICNPDGTPRRYRSKAEMRQVAKSRGLENYVRHIDGSPHTSRWV